MMIRRLGGPFGLAVLAWVAGAAADGADLGAFLPLKAKPEGEAGRETRLRGAHRVMLYAPAKGAPMALRVELGQVGRYASEVIAQPAGMAEKLIVRPESAGGPASGVLRFAAPKRGVVTVDLATSQNAATVTALGPNAWLLLEASERNPLHVISRVGKLRFFVPRSARSFTAFGRGSGTVENVRIRVHDPAGKQVGQTSAQGSRTARLRVTVPEAHRGKVWTLTADKPADLEGTFEDAWLWLSDDVPAHVSPQPDGLLVPFCSGLQQPPIWRGREPVELRFSLNVEPPPGAWLGILIGLAGRSRGLGGAQPADRVVTVPVRRTEPAGRHTLCARLMGADKTMLVETETSLTFTKDLVFVGAPQALVRAELQEREGQLPVLFIQRNVGGDLPLAVDMRLRRTRIPETPGHPGAESVLEQAVDTLGDQTWVARPPEELADGHYQWKVIARASEGEAADIQFAHFLVKGEQRFAEVPPPPAPPMPVLSDAERKRGFVAFAREAADAIVYNHRPRREEIDAPLKAEMLRDEHEPATFGVWAAEDVRGLRVSVSPLKHPTKDATLPVEVRLARHWPQRVSWRTSTYRIIPELLEPNASFDLALGQLKQVWLTILTAKDTPDGIYRATVTARDAKGRSCAVPLEVKVWPFTLERPSDVHWGLYSDSSRWRRYTDAQVRAELADIKAHGITTLMCYPPHHSTATMEGGKLKIDASEFVKYMRMAKEAGLGPPWVMSLQELGSTVKRLVPRKPLTDPEFKRVYQDYARFFVELAKREKLGECVWHTIDEPWSKEAQAKAAIQLGYMKELGLTTFTTAGPVSPEIDRQLDVRCYSIGHLLASPGVLDEQRRRTAASGDRLWFYGSGCYTGQDGNVISNRFITGFLFWKSGAEGVWSWTFLRAKGDVYDDFDGDRHREAKEACIVYPSTTGRAPTPTLQWEGIREGIDDYCYAYTILQLGKRAGLEDVAKRELDRLMKRVPIRRAPGDFTAADAQRLRREIIGIYFGHLCK